MIYNVSLVYAAQQSNLVVYRQILYHLSHQGSPGYVYISVQFSCSVMSDSLQPHEPQHARPPCPSPTPRVHPNTWPSSRWCHPYIYMHIHIYLHFLDSVSKRSLNYLKKKKPVFPNTPEYFYSWSFLFSDLYFRRHQWMVYTIWQILCNNYKMTSLYPSIVAETSECCK